jgi:hypothetical protein
MDSMSRNKQTTSRIHPHHSEIASTGIVMYSYVDTTSAFGISAELFLAGFFAGPYSESCQALRKKKCNWS